MFVFILLCGTCNKQCFRPHGLYIYKCIAKYIVIIVLPMFCMWLLSLAIKNNPLALTADG